jgi:hypothetical protein
MAAKKTKQVSSNKSKTANNNSMYDCDEIEIGVRTNTQPCVSSADFFIQENFICNNKYDDDDDDNYNGNEIIIFMMSCENKAAYQQQQQQQQQQQRDRSILL